MLLQLLISVLLGFTISLAHARTVTPRGPLGVEEQRIVSLFEAAAPSVAYITTEVVNTRARQMQVSQGAGSGFVWDESGHVVTNNHVIENTRRVFVQLDAGLPIEGTVIGRAPEYDLAVIKLSRPPAHIRAALAAARPTARRCTARDRF